MNKKEFIYYSLTYVYLLICVFLYQYTNIDDRLILVLIGISIVYLTYILNFKKIKSYTPRLIATLFIILSFFPKIYEYK